MRDHRNLLVLTKEGNVYHQAAADSDVRASCEATQSRASGLSRRRAPKGGAFRTQHKASQVDHRQCRLNSGMGVATDLPLSKSARQAISAAELEVTRMHGWEMQFGLVTKVAMASPL